MLYKILHKLFGWDYIYWDNIADTGIARIHVDAENKPFYWRYKSTKVLDNVDGTDSKIRWLTCPRSKYFPNKDVLWQFYLKTNISRIP